MEKCDKSIIKLIEKCDNCKLNECINCEISWAEVQEIKKLVDRVKELEEAVDNFMRGKAYSTKQLEKLKKNFIPKSKIREKIEEIKRI